MCERERDGQMGCHCLTGRHGIFLNSTGDIGLVQNRQENVKYMYSESQGTLPFLQIDKGHWGPPQVPQDIAWERNETVEKCRRDKRAHTRSSLEKQRK